MANPTLIGVLAGLLSTAAFLPQAWQIWSSRRAKDVSRPTYTVLIVAGVLWIIHGISNADPALIVTNAIIVVVSCAILAMKQYFDR